MTFYEIFEILCRRIGSTPTSVARDNGITQQAVSLWKKRGSTPNAATAAKIAEYFGVSVDCLVNSGARESFLKGLIDGEELRQSVLDSEETRMGPYWLRAKVAMEKLNAAGQAIAAERIEELTEIPKYKKEKSPTDGV